MADVTVKRLDEFESRSHRGMTMSLVRAGLGVSSFGIQVIRMPPDSDVYPEHDHSADGIGGQMFAQRPGQLDQEEVYTVLEGSATLRAGDEEHRLEPGVFARVDPSVTRHVLAGPDGVTVLAMGGVPGRAFSV